MADTVTTRRGGVSLAKGPVALIGLASLALGVLGFVTANHSFAAHPTSGTVTGGTFLTILGNGWTWVLFAAGGLLLLFGAPAHWGAKTMALLVALAYGAVAVIAYLDGKDALGIFAANHRTEFVLGVAAAALLILSLLPRVGRRREVLRDDGVGARGPARTRSGRFDEREVVERETAGGPRRS